VTSLSQIHLVSNVHYLSQTVALQMISLFDHPADTGEACTASRLVSPQGVTLKMRQDLAREIFDRARLILEGTIGL
jgi:hypothetical protein